MLVGVSFVAGREDVDGGGGDAAAEGLVGGEFPEARRKG